MSLRQRVTLAAAAAVAAAVALAAVVAYLLVRDALREEVDTSLRQRVERLSEFTERVPFDVPAEAALPTVRLGGAPGYVQFLAPDASADRPPGADIALPVDARTRRLARGEGGSFFRDATVDGSHVRILAAPLSEGGALQIARPLDETDQVLGRLRLVLGGVVLLGMALAVIFGRLVTRTALEPAARLSEASEHVAATRDLTRRIEAKGDDELARLARSFNAMLDALQESIAALDESAVAQRQLVADASHELRTPLTSIRTNLELLQGRAELSEAQRRDLLARMAAQIDELTVLVGDLIELARGDEPLTERQDVRLDRLVLEAVERRRRHAGASRFHTELEPTVVEGEPERLERAVGNLLDNAVKFSPAGEAVEVRLRGGELTVRDRGPGIDPSALPHVFDRFYRAPQARSVAGSGLGLAIVRQVALAHDGSVRAESAPGGGSLFRLTLPADGVDEAQAQSGRDQVWPMTPSPNSSCDSSSTSSKPARS